MATKLYFSNSLQALYASDVNQTMPEDSVEITAQTQQAIIKARSQNMSVSVDAEGNLSTSNIVPTPQQLAAALKTAAQTALDKSDITVTRTLAAGVVVNSDWLSFRAALRAIVSGEDTTSQTLPATPAFQPGT